MDSIKPDTPLRLDVALKIAFPQGGMTLSGLRRELKRRSKQGGCGLIETIARKDFTTLNAIEKMRELCRGDQQGQDSGSNLKKSTPTASGSATRAGSSVTERAKSARASLEKTARELKPRSASTSPRSTAPLPASAVVIPLRASSSTC